MAQHRNRHFGVSPETPHLAELSTSKIQPNPYQPRTIIPPKHLEELTASIKLKGQLDPIDVLANKDDPDTYILIDGQCRLKALETLGRDAVLAVIRQEGDPHELALILNFQRAGVHPLDEAASMALLIERFNYTQDALATTLSKPRSTVVETLRINDLPADILEECRALDIGKTHLVELARLVDQPDELQSLWDRLRTGERVGVRELQGRRRGRQAPARPADVPKLLMPVIRAIETTHRVRDQLLKIKPSSIITSHPDKLTELRELHKEIGGLIRKLERGGDKQTPKARGTMDSDRAPPATADEEKQDEPEEARE